MPRGLPAVELDLSPTPPAARDVPLCERLIRAFRSAWRFEQEEVAPENRPNEGVWEMAKNEFHGGLYALLAGGDAAGLAAYLANGLRTPFAHGLGPGLQVFQAAADPASAAAISTIIVDRLVALAEAVDALPYENPEQGRWGENIYTDPGHLAAAIERVCGHLLDMPRVIGNFGVVAGGRLVNVRTPDNVYTTYRMGRLLGGLTGRSVLEIGAGFGGTAYYCALVRARQYTIVDLPVMNVLQGFFLLKTVGEDQVALFGEQHPGARVRVLPYWEIRTFSRSEFDLTFNQDSLPEIPRERALEYIEAIPHFTREFFYSINQESTGPAGQAELRQLSVPRLTEAYREYVRVGRHPYWIRRGYVEEVYRLG